MSSMQLGRTAQKSCPPSGCIQAQRWHCVDVVLRPPHTKRCVGEDEAAPETLDHFLCYGLWLDCTLPMGPSVVSILRGMEPSRGMDYGVGSQAGHVSSFVLVFPALSMRYDAKGHLDDVG